MGIGGGARVLSALGVGTKFGVGIKTDVHERVTIGPLPCVKFGKIVYVPDPVDGVDLATLGRVHDRVVIDVAISRREGGPRELKPTLLIAALKGGVDRLRGPETGVAEKNN